ncbi:GNAT family N-acetyltransferase [Catenulispora subtropica]|uniref:GNAT family N-acetyltransferase n=1 Tax=Catenulispora subtropica TaxID=450798 RepID=A0ABN2R580_9ACTN
MQDQLASVSGLVIRPATPADRALLERLWLLFRHDMSEFDHRLPNSDGTFRSEWLVSAIEDADWTAYLAFLDDHPTGFAFVRARDQPTRVLNSFFITRGARRTGIGIHFAKHVLAAHPGPWEIAFQEANANGARFWRRLAQDLAPGLWREEQRPASRPDLPPNVWIVIP